MKIVVVALALILTQTPQNPVAQRSPEPASLAGIVRRLGTMDPVSRALVVLITEPAPPVAVSFVSLTTDESGRFAFQNVPPGRYRLAVTRDGYVRSEYGQRGPNSAPVVLTVSANQALKDVVVTMTPTGAIAGRVTNRFGEPVGNVAVQAQKYAYQQGRRVLNPVQTARTNDLGEYRIYYLPPGQYVLNALPPSATASPGVGNVGNVVRVEVLPGSPLTLARGSDSLAPATASAPAWAMASSGFVSAEDSGITYLPIYFPGTTEPSLAGSIDLQPGATSLANFVVTEVRAARIRGRVVSGVTGQPARGASVRLMSSSNLSSGPVIRTGSVADDGSFEFRGIPPGVFDVVAFAGSPLSSAAPFFNSGLPGGVNISPIAPRGGPAGAADSRLAARVSVEVGNVDLENIAVSLQPGYDVPGKITIEGRLPAEVGAMVAGLALRLQPDPGWLELDTAPAPVESNGTFKATGVGSGSYQIVILGAAALPRSAYVKTAQLDGRDALNPRLRIDGEPRGTLDIVIGTNPGTFDAAVVDDMQAPAPGATVVLVPDLARRQFYGLYWRAVANEAGRAHLDGIAPGDYTVYAWEDVEFGAWWDVEFMQKYQGRGTPVRIEEGGKATAVVRSIPYR